jgi:hypothetical protein
MKDPQQQAQQMAALIIASQSLERNKLVLLMVQQHLLRML